MKRENAKARVAGEEKPFSPADLSRVNSIKKRLLQKIADAKFVHKKHVFNTVPLVEVVVQYDRGQICFAFLADNPSRRKQVKYRGFVYSTYVGMWCRALTPNAIRAAQQLMRYWSKTC